MTKQITLEEALTLVSFEHVTGCGWKVGAVYGNVHGNVFGNVFGNVSGTINGCKWEFIETPEDKLRRLITASGNQELIDTFNQFENN